MATLNGYCCGPWIEIIISQGVDQSVMLLNKTLVYFHIVSFHLAVQMGNTAFNPGGEPLSFTFSALPWDSSCHSCYYYRMLLILPGQWRSC